MAYRKTLILDFDGVLHAYTSKYTYAHEVLDGPVPGAMAFLVAAMERFEVAIVSSRSHEPGGRAAMANWILDHITQERFGVSYTGRRYYGDEIDEGLSLIHLGLLRFPLHKPPAHLTIDDRAITFMGVWPSLEIIDSFVPWNKWKPTDA